MSEVNQFSVSFGENRKDCYAKFLKRLEANRGVKIDAVCDIINVADWFYALRIKKELAEKIIKRWRKVKRMYPAYKTDALFDILEQVLEKRELIKVKGKLAAQQQMEVV